MKWGPKNCIVKYDCMMKLVYCFIFSISDRRRDSRDSNASGTRDSSTSRKSTSQRDKASKSKVSSVSGKYKFI